MTIQVRNFSPKSIYVQDLSFITKGFTANCSSEYALTLQSTKLFPFKTFYVHDMLQGHVKAFSTGRAAEGILCGVMDLKILIFAKSREYQNMFSQKSVEFQLI